MRLLDEHIDASNGEGSRRNPEDPQCEHTKRRQVAPYTFFVCWSGSRIRCLIRDLLIKKREVLRHLTSPANVQEYDGQEARCRFRKKYVPG